MAKAALTIVGYLGAVSLDSAALGQVQRQIEATLAEDNERVFRGDYFGIIVGDEPVVERFAKSIGSGVVNPCANASLFMFSKDGTLALGIALAPARYETRRGAITVLVAAKRGREQDLEGMEGLVLLEGA